MPQDRSIPPRSEQPRSKRLPRIEGEHRVTTGGGAFEERVRAVPDDSVAGPRSSSGFTYQYECAALALLGHIGHTDLEAVVVERSTDIVLVPQSPSPVELVSIKHREPNQSGASWWNWSELKKDKVLIDLYKKWNAAGRTCTLAFWSNAGFSEGTHELWLTCAERQKPSPALIERVRDHISTPSAADAAAFLGALNLRREPLPGRADITDVGVQRTTDILREHRPRSAESARRCYQELLHRVTYAANLSRDPLEPVAAVAATLAAANERREELQYRKTYLHRTTLLNTLIFIHDQLNAEALPAVGWHAWEADTHFTGRDSYLERLDALLLPGEPIPVAPVVIHGGPGLGKTSLATNYAASRSETFRPVFINGAARPAIIRALAELADETNPERWHPDLVNAAGPVTPKLPGNSATLIIIDAVPDPSIVQGIVPRQSLCRILITTTRSHLDQGYKHIDLEPWTRESACRFIETAVIGSTREQREELAHALGDHPLALTQAVNYCQATQRPIQHFLQKLSAKPLAALELGTASGHLETTARSIELNIEAARRHEPAAFELLALLAQMSTDPFEETIFGHSRHRFALVEITPRQQEHPRRAYRIDASPSERAVLASQAVREAETLETAANTLVGMCLAQRRGAGLVVHPLVRLITREIAGEPLPWLEVGLAPFLDLLEVDAGDFSESEERHLGHARHLVETAMSSGHFGNAVGLVCNCIGEYLAIHGEWGAGVIGIPDASTFTGRVSALFREQAAAMITPWSIALELQNTHAATLAREGRAPEAERELFAALESARELGLAGLQVQALLNLSSLIVTVDRGRRAELVLSQLELVPEELINESPSTLASVAHLKAEALSRLNRIPEAGAVNRAALAALHEAKIPDRLRAELHADAVMYCRYMGKNTELLRHSQAVLEIRRKNSHGRPNWLLVDGLQQCADAAIDAMDLPLSERLITEAETLTREHFNTECREYGKVLTVRGRLNLHLGRIPEAVDDLKRGIEIIRGGTAVDWLQLPSALVHLAILTAHTGSTDEALELIDEAIERDTFSFGEEHPETQFNIDVRNRILQGESFLGPLSLWDAESSTQGLTWVFARLCSEDVER